MNNKKIVAILGIMVLTGTMLISGCQSEPATDPDETSSVISQEEISSEAAKEEASKVESQKPDKVSSKEETSSKPKEESKKPLESSKVETSSKVQNVSSEKPVEDKIIEIKVPKKWLAGEDVSLDEEDKRNGFIDVTKNSDGSATFTMKEKDYKKFVSNLRKTTGETIDGMNDGSYTSMKSIQYNKDFSEITIVVNKEEYLAGFDSMSKQLCSWTALLCQSYDVEAPGKCTVYVKDSATGEVFETEEFTK